MSDIIQNPVVGAFTVEAKAHRVELTELRWSSRALELFQAIESTMRRSGDQYWSLPTRSLRMLADLALPGLHATAPYMGLNPNKGSFGQMALVQGDAAEADRVVAEWIRIDLANHLERRSVDLGLLDSVQSLASESTLITVNTHRTYRPLADPDQIWAIGAQEVAAVLAGTPLFGPGVGPIERLIGDHGANQAHLISRPLTFPIRSQTEAVFSLLVAVSFQTVPGLDSPLLTITAGRRRWLTSWAPGYTAHRRGSGCAFFESHRPVQFGLSKQRSSDGWAWEPDDDFLTLCRKRQISLRPAAEAIVTEQLPGVRLKINYDEGLSDKPGMCFPQRMRPTMQRRPVRRCCFWTPVCSWT